MLYSKKERYDEHAQFLVWILEVIRENAVDTLLVAGDVFDSSSPSNTAQKMYYDFLLKVRNCGCRNVVVVGGNHDSPSLLDAPKEILAALNIKIVGKVTENLEDEIVVINNENGEPTAIICAVPFLRERDISRFIEGENYADRAQRIAESVRQHYATLAKITETRRTELGKNIPIIATGHLSVEGGQRSDDDGVRDTCVGTIEMTGSDIFSQIFDYVALGHFHIPSAIGGNDKIRYCGSPIPMGFGEARQQKQVIIVDFEKSETTAISVPAFQKLESIRGDKNLIFNRLNELKKLNESVWTEIIYDDNIVFSDFEVWVSEQINNTKIEVLKLQNNQHLKEALSQTDFQQSLEELDKFEVFDKLLEKSVISEEQKTELKESYNEITSSIFNEKEQ
jgi:exonuclease SbcD